MKRYLKILLVFVMGLFLCPSFVSAKELPTEGVTYFMSYPDNSEYVTESYDEAINPKEKLIYTAVTNENGEVILEGWKHEGQLRIVQHVPKGYSTDAEELTVDLGNKKAEFIDFRTILNPNTGRSILIIIALVAVILLGVFIFKINHPQIEPKSKSKGKKKTALLLIPIIGFGLVCQVFADDSEFVITVKDKNGNKLSGVTVDIYAKPVRVYGEPAVKFNANGGIFLDGSDTLYVKLPIAEMNYPQFEEYLYDNDIDMFYNIMGVSYKDNFVPIFPDDITTLKNGTEIKINWEYVSGDNIKVMTVHGNGGTLNFNGKKLTEFSFISDGPEFADLFTNFVKENSYKIGYDVDSSCSHYSSNGLMKYSDDYFSSSIPKDIYLCWNDKPDGIYVDDALFVGNDSSCFVESSASIYDNYINLNSLLNNDEISFELYNDEFLINYWQYERKSIWNKEVRSFSDVKNSKSPQSTDINVYSSQFSQSNEEKVKSNDVPDINKIEVVKDGRVIISLSKSDLLFTAGSDSFTIKDEAKRNQLQSYLFGINPDNCADMGIPDYNNSVDK